MDESAADAVNPAFARLLAIALAAIVDAYSLGTAVVLTHPVGAVVSPGVADEERADGARRGMRHDRAGGNDEHGQQHAEQLHAERHNDPPESVDEAAVR